MKRNLKTINKIIYILFLTLIMLIIFSIANCVKAASFNITSGINSTTVGDSYTITVKASGLTGRFNITHSDNVSVNVSSVWIDNGVADSTIKVTTKSTGKATVTLTPDSSGITDVNAEEFVTVSPQTDTVTVNAKSTSTGNSGSSSSGSSSSGSNQTSKPSFSSVNQTVYATSSVNVRASYTTSSRKIGSLSAGDSITRTGIGSNGWSRVTYNGQTAYINTEYLATQKPEKKEEEVEEKEKETEKSNNKDLKSLTVDGFMLTPEFSDDVTDYSLTINDDVDSLKITAEPVDEKAEVEIIGNNNLLIGDNTIQVKVTAEDGTIRTYRINVTKGSQEEFGLTSLTVEGYALTPEFDENTYEYTLEINDQSVTSLNINAEPSEENATVEITGNTNLQVGKNIITILVKSEDETENATYQVIVNINEVVEAQIIPGIDDEDLFMYAGIGIGVLVILIIIIILIVRHRRKNNDDNPYDNYYNAFNSLDKEEDSKKKDKEENKKELKDDSISNIKDKNINTSVDYSKEETKKEEPKSEEKPKRKERDSIIDKNFGDNVEYEDSDDKQKRKKGKHF